MFTVILDNGHGSNTLGKCSPTIDFIDTNKKENTSISGKRFREYLFARRVVKAAIPKLKALGYNAIQLVPEDKDISLSSRVSRINQYCKQYGAGNCVMVSTHVNAAGSADKWMSARGWSIWTTKGQNNSDKLSTCIYEAANELLSKDQIYKSTFIGEKVQKPIRTDFSDGDADYEANFSIIKGANCPATLVENMFQDNKEDVKFLESEHGFNMVVDILVNGVQKYAVKYGKK